MVIEFIGSTGAGKTTLFSAVQRRLAQSTQVTTAFGLVAGRLGLRGVTHPSLQNVTQELLGFPYFLGSLPRHRLLVRFVLGILMRHANLTLTTIYTLRSLVRKIGVDEIIKRNQQDHVVLVDEGLMVLAHNLFVYSGTHYTNDEVSRFAALVPLPDSIVYVKAPVDSLIRRASMRTDRREIQPKSREELERYIHRTVNLYEQLVSAERIRGRVLMVDNPESAKKVDDNAVDTIAEFVLSRPSCRQ